MSQFNIPVEVQAKFKQNPDLMNQFVSEVAKGSKAAREEFLKITNQEYKVQMVAEFNNSGQVSSKIKKINGDIDGLEKAWKKETKAQQGSVTNLTKRLSNLKQQQNAIQRLDEKTGKLNKKWLVYQRRINAANQALAKQKGGFQGMLAGMGKLGSVIGDVARFTPVLGKVMFAVQGVQQAFELLSMSIGKFVARQKAIQGFQMAMEGFGMSTDEANGLLDAAAGIGMKYGQNIQGIEKGLKRITPTMVAMGGSGKDAEAVMSSLAARMATLGLNSEQSGRYMEAFAQVMGKGKLQSEELNQQFSELDGALRPAVAEFVKANYGINDLDSAMQKGEVTAEMFAEAMVASSEEMRDSLGGAVDGIQNKIGKFNIQQMQNVIDNLNTKSLEEIGRQFESVGKVVISVQATFAQFFNSIVTQGSASGEFVSATLTMIGGALAFVADIAMISIKGLLNLVEVIMQLGKAIGEFIYNIPGLKQAFDFIAKIAQSGATGWGDFKDFVLQSNSRMREANETLTLGAGKLKDYSVAAGTAGNGVGELKAATAQLNPEITRLADEVLNAGSATASMSKETKEAVEAHVAQAQAIRGLIQAAQDGQGSMQDQVAAVVQLADNFDAATDSEETFAASADMVAEGLKSTTEAMEATLASLRQRLAAGEDLTQADRESLQVLPGLIASYRDMAGELSAAGDKVSDLASKQKDATLAVNEQVSAIANHITSMKNLVGPTGAFSDEERELAAEARKASESITAQIQVLENANSAILTAAGGYGGLSKEQSEQIKKNNDLANKLANTAKGYEELAQESTRSVNAMGQLNPALKGAIAQFSALAEKKNKTAKEVRYLETRAAALSQVISGDLSAATSSYNALIEKQIAQNGQLSASEEQRKNNLLSTIQALKGAETQMDRNIQKTGSLTTAVKTIKDEYINYGNALRDQSTAMQFSIEQAQRATGPLTAMANNFNGLGGQIAGVTVKAGQMKTAVDSQISSLEGFVQNLINAKVAGWELTAQQESQLVVATQLIEKLKEQSSELENLAEKTGEADGAAKSFSVSFTNMKQLVTDATNEMRYGSEASGTYAEQLARLQAARTVAQDVGSLISKMKEAKTAMDAAAASAGTQSQAFIDARDRYNDLRDAATDMVSAMDSATAGFQAATQEGDSYVKGMEDVTMVTGHGTLEFSELHDQVRDTTSALRDQIDGLDAQATSVQGSTNAVDGLASAQNGLTGATDSATAALDAQAQALRNIEAAMPTEDVMDMSYQLKSLNDQIAAGAEPVDKLTSATQRATSAANTLTTIEREMNNLRSQGVAITQEMVNAHQKAQNEATYATNELRNAQDQNRKEEMAAAASENAKKLAQIQAQELREKERIAEADKRRKTAAANEETRERERAAAAAQRDQEQKNRDTGIADNKIEQIRRVSTAEGSAQSAISNALNNAKPGDQVRIYREGMSEVNSQIGQAAAGTQNLSKQQEYYNNLVNVAGSNLGALSRYLGTEIVDGVHVAADYTAQWNGSLNEAAQSVSAVDDNMRRAVSTQIEALNLAVQQGDIDQKTADRKIKQLDRQREAIMANGQHVIEQGATELRMVESLHRMRQQALAQQMAMRQQVIDQLKEEYNAENAILQQINQRIAGEKAAMQTRIDKAKLAYDQQFAAADRLDARQKIHHDRRMAELNFQLEKARQIADARIRELEKLTPAEQALAALRERELRKQASSGATQRERLEARAALERLQRNKEIARQREKVEAIERRVNEELGERRLQELGLLAKKSRAEASYQLRVLKFRDIYESRVRDLLGYQIAARERLAAIDARMLEGVLGQERAREAMQTNNKNFINDRQAVLDNLNKSLDGLSQSAGKAIGKMGENIERATNGNGQAKLEAIQRAQALIDKERRDEARASAKQGMKDASDIGSARMTMAQDIRNYEMQTADLVGEKYKNMIKLPGGGYGRTLGTSSLPARAEGGPVSGGSTYQVNELGTEGFLSSSGRLSEIKAPSFGSWKAPGQGTVIPAHLWSEIKASQPTTVAPGASFNNGNTSTNQSALIAALSGLSGGSKDSITNNVTIQSQSPVQAASDMLVSLTKIRQRRRRG